MNNSTYKMNAFTENINGGNPAGVVLDADQLTAEEMLAIAKEVGFSETAFVMKSTVADYKVRFFTPVAEVDLCGHATIATFNLLRDLGRVDPGAYTQETKAGILKILINARQVFMEQNKPQFYEMIDQKEIEPCFQSTDADYLGTAPIQIVTTGLRDIIVQVKNLEMLLNIQPKAEIIDAISRKYDVVGIHAFCFETLNGGEAHTRNFAPRLGINEESATGTANGALACYLMKHFRNRFNSNFTIEQGYCMKKPSKIMVKIKSNDDEVVEVLVGGSACRIK
ncbi:MAG: PhzF family phenazine biosynthesis protein [Vallitaleaceae bacterium]|nr:PhzF family phenazine biosynthesis protein [Vallitaleaceae bacterium]